MSLSPHNNFSYNYQKPKKKKNNILDGKIDQERERETDMERETRLKCMWSYEIKRKVHGRSFIKDTSVDWLPQFQVSNFDPSISTWFPHVDYINRSEKTKTSYVILASKS